MTHRGLWLTAALVAEAALYGLARMAARLAPADDGGWDGADPLLADRPAAVGRASADSRAPGVISGPSPPARV